MFVHNHGINQFLRMQFFQTFIFFRLIIYPLTNNKSGKGVGVGFTKTPGSVFSKL